MSNDWYTMDIMPARKKSWKDTQSKLNRSKKTKLALLVLAFVFGLLIISWMTRFTEILFNTHKNYVWNGEFNINLLIVSKNISLLTFNPSDEKVTIINIPDETFLEVPGGYGHWQLQAVYGLGGDKLLKETLANFLAIPVDGFLDFSELQPSNTTLQIVETVRKNPFSGLSFLSTLKTDLTMWELLKLKVSIAALRFDKVKELNLKELGVLEEENLPDGTKVWKADTVKLDRSLKDLADPTIVSEHKSIAVLNATDHPGVAVAAARMISNLGGNVIITANAREHRQKTVVSGMESPTLKRLRQIFDPDGKISPSNEDLSSRAEISVLLGEDYFNR